jgi:PAS domain S-box-containing protein
MDFQQYAQYDCSELADAGAGRVWLCRLLRPTLGKKFLLLFAILLATGVANWLAVRHTLEALQGTTAQMNVVGSLRWLSQRAHLELLRFAYGEGRDRSRLDAHLDGLDEAIRALEDGGRARGIETPGLAPERLADLDEIRAGAGRLRAAAGRALAARAAGRDPGAELSDVYLEGDRLLERTDLLAAALTRQAAQAEARVGDTLLRLGLLDLVLLAATLLALRLRVVVPLRRLAAAAGAFAAGERGVRSGFRAFDEIGLVAASFDRMAETIENQLERLAADAQALRRSELALEKFALALTQAPVSVMITDAAGTIEYVNPKFTEVSGYAAEEVLGRNPRMLASGQTPRHVYEEMWRQLLCGRNWRGILVNRRKDGTLYREDISIAPLRDAGGRITHYVAVLEDITARLRAEEEIRRLNAELERRVAERTRQLEVSNHALETFAYSIAHDLRAPLRGINGFASLMAENCRGCANAESLAYMERIRRAAVRMGQLIDGLLEYSRVGRRALQTAPVPLSALAQEILEALAAAAPQRKAVFDIAPDLVAEGDAALLQDMLENLLGNAWKFTAGRDPAHIAFGCREEDGERVFFVRDDGAGFDMRYADKLFGVFQRLHGPQEFEGTGIGLAMVKRIVELHGGRIWAQSAPGEGATFYFTLGAAHSAAH